MSNYLKIATPISHQFENELFAQEIIKVSDCLEVRERSMESIWPRQFLTHIDFDLTHEWDSQIKDYLRMVIKTKPQNMNGILRAGTETMNGIQLP